MYSIHWFPMNVIESSVIEWSLSHNVTLHVRIERIGRDGMKSFPSHPLGTLHSLHESLEFWFLSHLLGRNQLVAIFPILSVLLVVQQYLVEMSPTALFEVMGCLLEPGFVVQEYYLMCLIVVLEIYGQRSSNIRSCLQKSTRFILSVDYKIFLYIYITLL